MHNLTSRWYHSLRNIPPSLLKIITDANLRLVDRSTKHFEMLVLKTIYHRNSQCKLDILALAGETDTVASAQQSRSRLFSPEFLVDSVLLVDFLLAEREHCPVWFGLSLSGLCRVTSPLAIVSRSLNTLQRPALADASAPRLISSLTNVLVNWVSVVNSVIIPAVERRLFKGGFNRENASTKGIIFAPDPDDKRYFSDWCD